MLDLRLNSTFFFTEARRAVPTLLRTGVIAFGSLSFSLPSADAEQPFYYLRITKATDKFNRPNPPGSPLASDLVKVLEEVVSRPELPYK